MKEEPKDRRIEDVQTSENGVPPLQAEQTPITPQKLPGEPNEVRQPSTSPSSPGDPSNKAPVSAKKLESNKKNAQKSPGPRTEAGKAKSANNSYKHGFYAKRLFPTAEQEAKDKSDYEAVFNGVYNDYQPVGFLENLCVEKIAAEALRLARLMGYEQEVMMVWRYPFSEPAADRILRFQNTVDRRIAEAIEELERRQAKRKAETASENLPQPEMDDSAAEPESSTPAVGGQVDEQPTDEAA
jgi:hypothetical protein